MKKFIAVIVSILFVASVFPKTGTDLKVKLQFELNKIAKFEEIPGITFSVLMKGKKRINLAAGYSDVEKKIKMKPGDIMFSGSIGKTYAAAVILQLADEGKLSLDDAVMKYFKDVKWVSRVPNFNKITVRMLLNHTTGIPRYAFHPSVWREMKGNPDKIWSGKDRLAKVFDMKPLHEPGKGWAYSDTNYIVLGMIIEKVTGNEYYSEVKKRFLLPLKLDNTAPANQRKLPGLIPGYCRVKALLLPHKVGVGSTFPFNPQMEWTGGGVVTNTSDLVEWGRLYYGGKLFSNELLKQARKPAWGKTDLTDDALYGFATIIWKNRRGTSYGHTGFFPGYVSIVQYYPQNDTALAMQLNTDKLPEEKSIKKILEGPAAVVFEYEQH